MPEISVIVPVYNVEKYLDRCVESILAQTFTDFELILVEDGSPDNCPQMCDEWAKKDSRIKVIHKENGGVSVARNSGLDIATGKYIAFCDSDDYLKSDFLKSLYDNAIETKADVVVSNYARIDDTGVIDKQTEHKTGVIEITTQQQRWNYLEKYALSHRHGWEVWTRLFKASIIKENNIHFCTTCQNYAEDLGFVFEYCLYAQVVSSVNNVNYCYFVRTGSMMRTSKNVIKLDQLNEVSAFVYPKYKDVFTSEDFIVCYAIFHFLMLNNEYGKIVGTDRYPFIGEELAKINNKEFYYNKTKAIRNCMRKLTELYGNKVSRQILLFSHYCIHQNWKRFSLESSIAYRFFIKGD